MRVVTVCMLTLIFLSGCQSLSQPPMSMVKEPTMEEKKRSLLNTFKNNTEEGAELAAAKSDKKKQGVQLQDLDRDGEQEAILFHTSEGYPQKVTMRIYELQEHKWRETFKRSFEGNDLHTFKLDSLTNRSMMYVGITTGKDQYELYVMQYQEGDFLELSRKPYTKLLIEDLNQNQRQDFTILMHERGKVARASLFEVNGNQVEELSSVELDQHANGYSDAQIGWVSEKRKGAIFQAQVGAHSAQTFLLIADDNQLKRVFNQKDNPLYKPYPIESRDIDGDGIIELANQYAPEGQFSSMVGTPWIDVYYEWKGGQSLVRDHRRYTDFDKGFIVTFPDKWPQKIGIQRLEGQQQIQFINQKSGEVLYHVKWTETDKWKASDSFLVVHRTDSFIYEVYKDPDFQEEWLQLWADEMS